MRLFEVEKEIYTSPEYLQQFITSDLKKLGSLFEKNDKELRIVGGAVRDILLGNKPKDIDLATDSLPQESMEILKNVGIKVVETGLEHGTITAVMGGENYEITTLRVDKETYGRHADVEYTTDWKEDARRRDLTINAMSLGLDGTLYDYFGGVEDLKGNKASFVGDASERIQEDYLRILRYFRFQGRTRKPNFDKETLEAIEENASGLKNISGERIWQELSKILTGDHTKEILKKMMDVGVDLYIELPSLNLQVLDRVKKHSDNPATILAAMLQNEKQVNQVVSNWKLSAYERELMKFIVNYKHKKFDLNTAKMMWTNMNVKKDYILELARFFGRDDIVKYLQNWNPEFPVSGNDLKAIGYESGPELGRVLKDLKQKWIDSDYTMSKDELLDTLEVNERFMNDDGSMSLLTYPGTEEWQNEEDYFKKWFSRPYLTGKKK